MQNSRQSHRKKSSRPLLNQVGDGDLHAPFVSSMAASMPPTAKHLSPIHGVEFQPSSVCPRNYIIFDQNDHRSQIMYHPEIAYKFSTPGTNVGASYWQENFGRQDVNYVEREVPSLKEDSDDIDMLLSLEDDDQEESDEEEISTARTYGNYGSNSPDSWSNYGSKCNKNGPSSMQNASGSSSSHCSERKRQKMKKMVRALRGIVPGGDQMNTAAVLDEAVRYLKSLKVEAQKLGVEHHKK